MIRQKPIGKTPREHFMRALEDEFEKFEHKERAFRQQERSERAAQLRLPFTNKVSASVQYPERK